jgi:hypothetical protein
MALNISYFTGADQETGQCYGTLVSSAAYTVTGSSASVGTPPAFAGVARLKAGEGCYVSNNGTAASSTNGVYLAAGDSIDLEVRSGVALLAITG